MPPFLKVKTAGLPRWAWIGLFGGAVGVGLYLRHRSVEGTENSETENPEIESEGEPGELGYYNGTDAGGGLAAAGVVGPPPGGLTPIQTPYLPEGIVDIFEEQGKTIQELAGDITEREPGERVETIREVEPVQVTGGGAPKRNHQKKPGSHSSNQKKQKPNKQHHKKQPKHKQKAHH